MKKITLLLALLLSTSWLSAQCLSAPNGLYPSTTYTPECDGLTQNSITIAGYAGEYSMVNVIEGEPYVFGSSIAGDYITISNQAGTEAYAFGGGGSLQWVSDVTGPVRFYTHTSDACGSSTSFRQRWIICGTPPDCSPVMSPALDDVTEVTATIVWVPSISDPSEGYDYILSEDPTAPEEGAEITGTIPAGEDEIELAELLPTTTYYFWIRANCGSDSTSTWKSVQFTTTSLPPSCEEITVIECNTETEATLAVGPGAWNPESCGYDTPGTEALFSYTPTMTGPHNLQVISQTGGWVDYFWKEAGSCDDSDWNCINDIIGASTNPIGVLEEGVTYWFLLDSEGTDAERNATFLITCPPTCTEGEVAFNIVPDCEEGEQFYISVDLTDMGTAESYTVSDDQGSETQSITEAGTLQFGPYPNQTMVEITLANDQDETCVMESGEITMNQCPPANDTCETAIDLATLTAPHSASTEGALNDSQVFCNNGGTEGENFAPDVYYSIVVPAGSTLTIGQTSNSYDSTNRVFYGDCDNQTIIKCFDDDDTQTVVWANDTGEEQTVYWIQDGYFDGFGNYTLDWSVVACSNPVATTTIVPMCDEGEEQFMINVNLTSLGSATTVTMTDDQGSEPITASEAGEYLFGPFSNQTPVIITIANDDDADCSLVSNALTQFQCPPNCENATVIEACATSVSVTLGGTGTWNGAQCGFGTPGSEAVYSFTPETTGMYNLVITAATGGYMDYFYKEASGSCDQTGWTCIGDANGAETNEIGLLEAGTEYLILVDSEGASERSVTFNVSCAVEVPENDACETATVIEMFPFESAGDATAASNNNGYIMACGGQNDGVWFSFVGDGGDVTISITDTGWDSEIGVFTGECGTFECVDYADNSGTGGGESLEIPETEVGVTYYVNLGYYSGFGNSPEGPYTISATSTMMGVGNNDLSKFSYHPNPVKDQLHLSNASNMTSAVVYNLLGQQVMTTNINATVGKVDMTSLPAGTYVVKVQAENMVKSIKVVKK